VSLSATERLPIDRWAEALDLAALARDLWAGLEREPATLAAR
jgi:hypothetical protein